MSLSTYTMVTHTNKKQAHVEVEKHVLGLLMTLDLNKKACWMSIIRLIHVYLGSTVDMIA